ncbi:MAG: Cu(I)/Ag(I) efflux system membrane protein CusA/SilA, partial [Cognaticolwellia sp.]
MTPPKADAASAPQGLWQHGIGWFIENRLIVFLLTLMLIMGGIFVMPFEWDSGDLPRDPVPVDAIPDIGENQQIVFT